MVAEVAISHLRMRLRGLPGAPASADSFFRSLLAALERELEAVIPATGELILLPCVTLDLRVVVPPGASIVDAIARAMAAQLSQIAATANAVRAVPALPTAAAAPEVTPARAHLLGVAAQAARAGRSGREIAALLAAGAAAAEAGSPLADAPEALVALALSGTCPLALLGRIARRRLLPRLLAALDDASACRMLVRIDDELAAAALLASPELGEAPQKSRAPSLPGAADIEMAAVRIAAAEARAVFALPAASDVSTESSRLVLAIAELARVTPAAVLRSTALRAALREAIARLVDFAVGSPRAPEELPSSRRQAAPPPESAHGVDTAEAAGDVAATAPSLEPAPARFEAVAALAGGGPALLSSDAGTLAAGELVGMQERGAPALLFATLTAAHPIAWLGRLCRMRLLSVLLAALDPAVTVTDEAPAAPLGPLSRPAPASALAAEAADRGHLLLMRIGEELLVPSPRPLAGLPVSAAAAFEIAAAEARALRSIAPVVDGNAVPPHLRLILAVAELARVTPAALVGSISLRAAVLDAIERLRAGVRAMPSTPATSSWPPLLGDDLAMRPLLLPEKEPVAHLAQTRHTPKSAILEENVAAVPSVASPSARDGLANAEHPFLSAVPSVASPSARDGLANAEHPFLSAVPSAASSSAVDFFSDDVTARSAAAGLAFLVRPVLDLGWPDRLAAIHPEPSLALHAIFRRILALSLDEDAADDPAAWLLAGLLDAPSLEEREADALTFSEGQCAALARAGGAEAATFADLVDAWARAILDEARLRLAGTSGAEDLARDVLAIGGVLACCETHVEVRLPFTKSYEALLRAGLSLDIADVAWLDDRSLRFVFGEEE